MIFYLHGFRSSPASHKAQCLKQRMAVRGVTNAFWCEPLPAAPAQAMRLIEAAIEAVLTGRGRPTVVGSSLGGLYASVIAQKYGLPAVLINPAVLASITLENFIGRQTNLHTGQSFEFTAGDVEGLRQLEALPLGDLSRTWVLLEAGDEVLDVRAALDRFKGARITLHEGGDHSFTRFEEHVDEIIDLSLYAQGG